MGNRIGWKRSDRRYRSDDGQEWASRFEYEVFDGLRSAGYHVRKCDESDAFTYHTSVIQGCCLECRSEKVVQRRTYTPDLFVAGRKGQRTVAGDGYYVECKGYFPREKRNLFRSFANQTAGVDLRIIFSSEVRLKGTKMTNVEYIGKYCKGVIPGIWKKGEVEWK